MARRLLALLCLLVGLAGRTGSPVPAAVQRDLLGREFYFGQGREHKMRLWVAERTANVRFVFVMSYNPEFVTYLGPEPVMYQSPEWRAYISALGGALAVQENTPHNEVCGGGKRCNFRADFRKQNGTLAKWVLSTLASLAQQSGRHDLAHAPLVLWGFSREAIHPVSFAEVFPDRVLGGIRQTSHLRDDVFTYQGPLRHIPFHATIGEDDRIAKMNNIEFLRKGRCHGAPWSCTLIRHAKHGEGYGDNRTTAFIFPWLAEILAQAPAQTLPYRSPPRLTRFATVNKGWLGNMDRIVQECFKGLCASIGGEPKKFGSLEGNVFNIAPFSEFPFNKSSASWLPGPALAAVWRDVNELGPASSKFPRTALIAVVVAVPRTMEGSPEPAIATIVRNRLDTELPRGVTLELGGTARVGEDYQPVPLTVKFEPGSFAAEVRVTALADSVGGEGAETVVVSVAASPDYLVLENNAAELVILDVLPSLAPVAPGDVLPLGPSGTTPDEKENGTGNMMTAVPPLGLAPQLAPNAVNPPQLEPEGEFDQLFIAVVFFTCSFFAFFACMRRRRPASDA